MTPRYTVRALRGRNAGLFGLYDNWKGAPVVGLRLDRAQAESCAASWNKQQTRW